MKLKGIIPLSVSGAVAILSGAKILKDRIAIEKTISHKDMIIEESPKQIIPKAEMSIYISAPAFYHTYINNFIKEVRTSMPHVSLDNFYRNLKNLKVVPERIVKDDRGYEMHGIAGLYLGSEEDSTIKMMFNNPADSIYHELAHMASSNIKGDSCTLGFLQTYVYQGTEIGRALNEGYTETINERYFQKYGADCSSYEIEKHLCSCLEYILGRKNMETWYFNADLYSLIEELKKYESVDNILHFIKSMDYFLMLQEEKMTSWSNKMYYKYGKKVYVDMLKILLKMYSKKLTIEYKNGTIDKDTLKQKLEDYMPLLLGYAMEDVQEKVLDMYYKIKDILGLERTLTKK